MLSFPTLCNLCFYITKENIFFKCKFDAYDRERVGVQVELWNPLRTRAILSASAVVIHYEEALYQVYAPLPFTFIVGSREGCIPGSQCMCVMYVTPNDNSNVIEAIETRWLICHL